jgi:hypothetical protein
VRESCRSGRCLRRCWSSIRSEWFGSRHTPYLHHTPCLPLTGSILGRDMHHRVAHWRTLVKMGWDLPPHSAVSRPEALEEERLQQAMIEAQKLATEEDSQMPLRTFRIIVGVKGVE